MPTVLITGANRGIGLEFVRQYADRGWSVIACCRSPADATDLDRLARSGGVRVEALDLARDDSIAALAGRLGDLGLDVLVNNAALLGPGRDQVLGKLSRESLVAHYQANAAGPLLLTQALLPRLERGGQRKLVFLGSAAGSASLLLPPANLYAYRPSKAALHLLARNLSLELKPRGITVALLNPGLTDTRGLLDLAPEDPGPEDLRHVVALVRAGRIPMVRPAESVAGMIGLIDGWTPAQSGTFLNYDGQALPF